MCSGDGEKKKIGGAVPGGNTGYKPKKSTGAEHHTHTHNTNTTHKNKMSRCLPTPSGFAISPWQHLPWPQIVVPRLPTSLLQAPGGGFALAVAGSLGWAAELRCIKNREGDGSSALGGRRLVVRHNNQPIVGGSNMMDDVENARPRWGVWGWCFLYFGAAN